MADTPEAVRKSLRTYKFIGAVLFIGTILTVLVATVPWLDVGHHGFDMMDAILGLAIATTKATLVAAVFMHLNHEKKAVYWIFASGLFFVFWLFFLIGLAKWNPIHDPYFFSPSQSQVPAALEIPKSGA
jgi:caa(3)-type oxidase subunit IV